MSSNSSSHPITSSQGAGQRRYLIPAPVITCHHRHDIPIPATAQSADDRHDTAPEQSLLTFTAHNIPERPLSRVKTK